MAFSITYAGKGNEEYNLMAYKRPDYSASEEEIEEFSIPGRESNLYHRTGHYANNELPVTFNYTVTDRDQWGEIWRRAVCWLRQDGDYIQSDDDAVYRKVAYVRIETNEREAKRLGRFDAVFVCKPGEYYLYGREWYEISSIADSANGSTYIVTNEYSECRPRYRITGNGGCSITVNGNTMEAAVDTDMIIDTDKKIAYRVTTGVSCNTGVTGDYDGLVLVPGENTITVSGNGIYTWEIEPNWRVT